MFLPCSIELDLPPSYLKSKSPSKEIIQKKKKIKNKKIKKKKFFLIKFLENAVRVEVNILKKI